MIEKYNETQVSIFFGKNIRDRTGGGDDGVAIELFVERVCSVSVEDYETDMITRLPLV